MPKKRRTQALLTATALIAAAAAGGINAAASSATTKPTLVVYSAQGYDSAMVKAFTKATGIPTKLDDNSTGPLLTQIEASKNNPNWGILWVDGDTAFAELDKQGLLQKGFEPTVDWTTLGKSVVPTDGSYTPTGITLMAALAYNKSTVPDPPSTWKQLLSSKWAGKIGMNDPSQSGPTFPFIAGIMNYLGGVSQGKSFFQTLKSNGLVVNATNGPTLQALASGQIDIALVQSSAAIGDRLGPPANNNIGIKYLSPMTLLPSAIGIDAKAPAAERLEAEKFIEFVLSKQGQHVMQTGDPTGDSLYYPVIDGIKPLPALPSLSSVKTQRLDPYTWGPRETSVNTWFDSSIK